MKAEIFTRKRILADMDIYVRKHVTDEDAFETWLLFGVPDGANEGILNDIAMDIDNFNSIVRLFGRLISQYDFDEGRKI